MKKILLIVIILATFVSLWAQEKKETEKKEDSVKKVEKTEKAQKPEKKERSRFVAKAEPIIITPDREPVYLKDSPEIVTVVTAEEIKRMQVNSTTEVLEKVTGVFMETGTGSGFPKRGVASVNGLPANYVLVLLNGARLLSEHIHTGQNIDTIPPESIERIEIIKTAASAQYGSDAIGGVINIITYKKSKKVHGKAYGKFGSYKTMNAGAKLTAPLGEKAHLSLFSDVERSEGIPLISPAHRVDNEGYNTISLINTIKLDPTSWFSADINGGFFSKRMEFRGERAYSRLIMPGGKAKIKFNDQWSLNASFEYADWASETSTEKNRLILPQLYTSWKGFNNKNLLNFGVDYRHSWFERTGIDEMKDQFMFGVFIHDALKITDQWHASASVRLDVTDSKKVVVSPKVALMYKPIEDFKLRFAFSRGFHSPTVQELYEEGYGHGGTAYRFGNEDLKPEYSTAFSLSGEYSPHKTIEFFVNGYLSLIDNFIVPQYEGPWDENPDVDVWRRENILRAIVYGVEFSSRWTPLEWMSLKVGYTYAGNKKQDDEKELRFHPGHAVFATLDLEKDITAKWQIGGFFSFKGAFDRKAWSWKPDGDADRDDETGYITELGDYQMLSLGVQITYDKTYQIAFKANNLLGQDIENLDDALTKIDGEPTFYGSLRIFY